MISEIDFQNAVLDMERVGKVFPEWITGDLGNPSVEIFSVEELNPFLLIGIALAEAGNSKEHG